MATWLSMRTLKMNEWKKKKCKNAKRKQWKKSNVSRIGELLVIQSKASKKNQPIGVIFSSNPFQSILSVSTTSFETTPTPFVHSNSSPNTKTRAVLWVSQEFLSPMLINPHLVKQNSLVDQNLLFIPKLGQLCGFHISISHNIHWSISSYSIFPYTTTGEIFGSLVFFILYSHITSLFRNVWGKTCPHCCPNLLKTLPNIPHFSPICELKQACWMS